MKKRMSLYCIGLLATLGANAATYTWDGGGANSRWTTVDNWVSATRPSSDNTTDLIFSDSVTRDSGNLYGNWTVRSLTFDDSIGADGHSINVYRSASFKRTLTFEADAGNASVNIASGSTGNITINEQNSGANAGTIVLNNSLDIVHDGSGMLTLNLAVNQQVGEANGINKFGTGALVMTGTNTYTGSTIVHAGSLTLSNSGLLTFDINAGANSSLSGVGTVNIDGAFALDLTDATTALNDTWSVVDVTQLDETFGATFSVVGFTDVGDNTWTLDIDGTKAYEFSEVTGNLTVIPEPATLGLIGFCGVGLLFFRRIFSL